MITRIKYIQPRAVVNGFAEFVNRSPPLEQRSALLAKIKHILRNNYDGSF